MKRRNDASMEQTLRQIGTLWKKYPDMRLGQLIANAVGRIAGTCDPFYFEDADLIAAIQKFAEETRESNEK